MSDARTHIAQRVTTMQIIAGALIMGVVTFTAVAVVMVINNGGQGTNPQPSGVPLVSIIAGLMLLINAPLSLFLPGGMALAAMRNIVAGRWHPPHGSDPSIDWTNERKLIGVRQTSMIIALALIEGAAFCAAIGYLLEGSPIALGVVVVALGLLVWHFPTEGGVREWLDRHARELDRAKG